MDKLLTLTEEDFLAIEDALGANARGRAFLRMRDQRARAIAADEVKRLMKGLTASFKKTTAAPAEKDANATHIRILRQELQEMSVYIQQTRSEIAALRPDDSGNNRIMAATGELDAIVTATERATSDILNGAERIQALVSRLPRTPETTPICEDLEAQCIEILTACSFQDITGQRTTKVVNTLRYLEKRVNSMIEIWGVDALKPVTPAEMGDSRPDAHLLNGPSLEGGVSQDDVDALLAGLNMAGGEAKPEAAAPAPAAATPAPAAALAAATPKPAVKPLAVKETVVAAPPAPPNGALNGGVAINQNDIDALFD
jgi:chemotaxis regulatin CheY-phosphate phosphatase CheZ